jgi:RNA polymerase sigma-70 factor, ECF subfamily
LVQAEDLYDSIKTGLIAMLPRLKRFADLLTGERRAGAGLLGRALRHMLAEEHRYQRGTPLDLWAFAEIYQQWLEELRSHSQPMGQDKVDNASFERLFRNDSGEAYDPFTAKFLSTLPPQQRLTLLLVYGERFDHIEAGHVLDVTPETIRARLVRITASLADQLRERGPMPQGAPLAQ